MIRPDVTSLVYAQPVEFFFFFGRQGKQKQKKGKMANQTGKKKAAKKKRKQSKHTLKQASTQSNESPKKNRTEKSPVEASNYLIQWEAQKSGRQSAWKFNKNTQSWLIRNMYDLSKVPKATFTILLRYLEGLEGEMARSRLRTDASRRALRYKEHLKTTENKTESINEASTEKKDSDKKIEKISDDEEQKWKSLDEHDKRKEYKRARKILEIITSKKE